MVTYGHVVYGSVWQLTSLQANYSIYVTLHVGRCATRGVLDRVVYVVIRVIPPSSLLEPINRLAFMRIA